MKDYYTNYREHFGDNEFTDIENYTVMTTGENRVGKGKDLLVDETGRFRYIVVDTEPWVSGKNVLLPVGLARFDQEHYRIFVEGLSKAQVENLPSYREAHAVDEHHENQVREQYRPLAQRRSQRHFVNDREDQSTYGREPTYYGLSAEDNQQSLKLYEERLITQRNRVKTGAVTLGKHVETETAEVAEPIEKERVVIERQKAGGRPVAGKDPTFEDEEMARMEVFEDRVDVQKEPFVREEVSMRKERDRDTVKAQETLRHEALDIDTEGHPRSNR
jgi:uncharacterized protein (TIGR02271 family)